MLMYVPVYIFCVYIDMYFCMHGCNLCVCTYIHVCLHTDAQLPIYIPKCVC